MARPTRGRVPYNQHGFNPFVPRGSSEIVAFGTEPTPELFLPPHDGGIGVRRSNDDGHTWSGVEIIDPVNSRGYCGVGHMRGCEMDSGAWLLPTYSVRNRTDQPAVPIPSSSCAARTRGKAGR